MKKALLLVLLMVTVSFAGVEEGRIDGNVCYGCQDQETFSRITSLLLQGDKAAFSGAIAKGLRAGTVVPFENNERVYKIDSAYDSRNRMGLHKLRKKGDAEEYWTFSSCYKRF